MVAAVAAARSREEERYVLVCRLQMEYKDHWDKAVNASNSVLPTWAIKLEVEVEVEATMVALVDRIVIRQVTVTLAEEALATFPAKSYTAQRLRQAVSCGLMHGRGWSMDLRT